MALKVKLVEAGRIYASVAVIKVGGAKAPIYWLPFDDAPAKAVFPLGDREMLAVGDYDLRVFDVGAQLVVRETKFSSSCTDAVLSADRNTLYLMDGATISAWEMATLDRTAHFNAVMKGPVGLRLTAIDIETPGTNFLHLTGPLMWRDGRLAIQTYDPEARTGKTSGTLLIDPANWRVEHDRTPAKPKFVTPKPLGRDTDAEAYVASLFEYRQPVAAMTPAAISEALTALATQIEQNGLKGIARSRQLNLVFDVGGKAVPEHKFFDAIVRAGMKDVVQPLRRLMQAYLDKVGDGEGEQPSCTSDPRLEAVAGLGFALRALVLLHPASTDLFRLYLQKRDAEHESFTWDKIYPAFAKQHGFGTDALLRFGVCATLHTCNSCSGSGVWKKHGLLKAARERLSGAAFADMILAEVDAFAPYQADTPPEERAEDDFDTFGRELLEDVAARDPFSKDLYARLAERWPQVLEESGEDGDDEDE